MSCSDKQGKKRKNKFGYETHLKATPVREYGEDSKIITRFKMNNRDTDCENSQ